MVVFLSGCKMIPKYNAATIFEEPIEEFSPGNIKSVLFHRVIVKANPDSCVLSKRSLLHGEHHSGQ
jgi:hypothetical protein